ncbi:MAG: nif11-like peptide radical SAM maturase [Syntrophomonas sp.]
MNQKVVKPYHLFKHQGGWYAINIEEMCTRSIDEKIAGALTAITADPDAPLEPLMKEQLDKLGLLSIKEEQNPKAKQEKYKEPIPVVNMNLLLTQSCNLKCVYCYGDGGKYGAGGMMEENTAFQAVDWMLEQSGKIKKLYIGFFGGEPFLNFPLMKAVVEYAKKRVQKMGKQVVFHTTTNATLLDDEKIAFMKEHQIQVMISFDGPREIQDAQRPYVNGAGTFDSTVPKIRKLLAVLPETPGHAVVLGNTDPQYIKNAMQEIGFAQISTMPVSQSLFQGEPGNTNSDRDTRVLLRALEEEAETWMRLARNRDGSALKSLKDRSQLYQGLISLLHNTKPHHACEAGLGLVGVSCTGDIYLCHRFVGQDEYKLGSVFAHGLNREKYQKSPTTGNGKCATCFARYYCAGGCKHDNAGSCGSISEPSEDACRLRCRELELAATIIGRLEDEDKAFLAEQQIFPPKPCPLDF